jgi:AraC-like DNA-binding protein
VINHDLGFGTSTTFCIPIDCVRQARVCAIGGPSHTRAHDRAGGRLQVDRPFNRAFRERFGMTPTEYRRASDDDAERADVTALQTHTAPR